MTQSSVPRSSASEGPHIGSADGVRNAISAIAPYIEDNAIEWEDLRRVLDSVRAGDALRDQLTAALRQAGISIQGSPTPAKDAVPEGSRTASEAPSRQDPTPADAEQAAVSAARRLMEQDARRTRLEKWLLTAQEEVGLALIIRGGASEGLPQGGMATLTGERRRAAETLYLHNTRLAWSVAQKYVGQGLELDDLAQSAMVGLIRAVEMFDPHAGHKFSTYATWWLRQTVTRAIADQGRTIRVPVHMHERIQKVWRTREELFINGVAPRLAELARACKLTPKQVQECLTLRDNILSLDHPIGDNATSLGDLLDLPDSRPTPFSVLWEKSCRDDIESMLDTLSEREAGVIALRTGLNRPDRMTLDAIGEMCGVTRERIRQIEKKALEKLRHHSRADVLRVYLSE